jgi:hypothetical protein
MKNWPRIAIQVFVLILLVAGVGAGVYLVQQSQIFKSKAASSFSLEGFKMAYGSCDVSRVKTEERASCEQTKSSKRYDPQYDIDQNGWINLIDYFQLLPQFKDVQSTPSATTN